MALHLYSTCTPPAFHRTLDSGASHCHNNIIRLSRMPSTILPVGSEKAENITSSRSRVVQDTAEFFGRSVVVLEASLTSGVPGFDNENDLH